MAGAGQFLQFELGAVRVAEQAGIPLGYATDVDLHADPSLLDGARGMVTLGHDEYWSTTMRTAATVARDQGVNLAFLGGNEVYRHIRFEATPLGPNRLEINYKSFDEDPASKTDPLEATQDWRLPPEPAAGERARRQHLQVLPRPRGNGRGRPVELAAQRHRPRRAGAARRDRHRVLGRRPERAHAPPAGGALPLARGLRHHPPARLRRRRLLHDGQRRGRVRERHPGLGVRHGPVLHGARAGRARRPRSWTRSALGCSRRSRRALRARSTPPSRTWSGWASAPARTRSRPPTWTDPCAETSAPALVSAHDPPEWAGTRRGAASQYRVSEPSAKEPLHVGHHARVRDQEGRRDGGGGEAHPRRPAPRRRSSRRPPR